MLSQKERKNSRIKDPSTRIYEHVFLVSVLTHYNVKRQLFSKDWDVAHKLDLSSFPLIQEK